MKSYCKYILFTTLAAYTLLSCQCRDSSSEAAQKLREKYACLYEEHVKDAPRKDRRSIKKGIVETEEDYAMPIATDNNLSIARLTVSRAEQILIRPGYITSYNNSTKCPNWVAWRLTDEHTDGQWSRKGIPYMVDEEVQGARQELEDWENHGLPIDHGHMCPAGDNKWSSQAMQASFLLTNFCPQNRDLNQGDWEKLESRCRGWARHYGEVFIACGPIFYNSKYKTIGDNKVGVPDAFFKVILRMGMRPAALGFIYLNQGGHKDMSQYVVTVDEVEAKTGIDFFYNLPDVVENVVEAKADIRKW